MHTHPTHHVIEFIGESFKLATLGAGPHALTSKPDGSRAAIEGVAFTPDVAGEYVVRVGVEGQPGWHHRRVFAFPAAALTDERLTWNSITQRARDPRAIMRSLVNHGAPLDWSACTASHPYPHVRRQTGVENGVFESVEPNLAHHGA